MPISFFKLGFLRDLNWKIVDKRWYLDEVKFYYIFNLEPIASVIFYSLSKVGKEDFKFIQSETMNPTRFIGVIIVSI